MRSAPSKKWTPRRWSKCQKLKKLHLPECYLRADEVAAMLQHFPRLRMLDIAWGHHFDRRKEKDPS